MPMIYCKGVRYSGEKGDAGVGIAEIIQNEDKSLSIYLTNGREFKTRPIEIVDKELPSVTEDDYGKSLVVDDNGNWSLGSPKIDTDSISDKLLPLVTNLDVGKILMVNESGNWEVVPFEIAERGAF